MTTEQLCKRFQIEGEYLGTSFITDDHINDMVVARFLEDGKEKKYVIQKINPFVFRHISNLMVNIENVTDHIIKKMQEKGIDNPNGVLRFCRTKENRSYIVDEYGKYYRIYHFIDNSITYDHTSNLDIIKESGIAFGEFQNYLKDFPIDELYITIPNFHNTFKRYNALKKACKEDENYRYNGVKDLVDKYNSLYDDAIKLYDMYEKGLLPLRVTHNDTRINNILFDISSKHHLAVIDLDTVMPGLVGFDFGDAIRFSCSTAQEDEKDLDKVTIDLDKFKAFSLGFLSQTKDALTKDEISSLVDGVISITLECGVRFLTDYLRGDEYFKTEYPGHNLIRSKCQLKLATEMLVKKDEMKKIIEEIINNEGN